MVGLSAQQILRQRMDVTANNLANMTTAGFKAESVITRPLAEAPATAADTPNDIAFADAWTLQRDFSAGEMERTGNPLDLAIEGEGFFTVQTPAGPAYTRDGRFSLDAAGQLVTRAGQPVLAGGGPLTLDPTAGNVAVARDGSVSQNGLLVGALDIVALRVASGFIEGSNVNAIEQITQMIEISRTYQSVSKMISQADELRATSIEKLARVG